MFKTGDKVRRSIIGRMADVWPQHKVGFECTVGAYRECDTTNGFRNELGQFHFTEEFQLVTQFKVGDRVRRTGRTQTHVTKGGEYVVRRVDGAHTMYLEGCEDAGYMPEYFELVVAEGEVKYKVGQELEHKSNPQARLIIKEVVLEDTSCGFGRIKFTSGSWLSFEQADRGYPIKEAVVPKTREPRAGDVFKPAYMKGDSHLHGYIYICQDGTAMWVDRLLDYAPQYGIWKDNSRLGEYVTHLQGFDCSDTDNTTTSEDVEIKEALHMSEFKKGDRVYRLGTGWSKAGHGEEGSVLGVNVSGSLVVQMDNGHKTPNGSSKKFALVTPRNTNVTQGGTMPFKINIKSQTLVNGTVIDKNTTDEAFYGYISDAEAEIARLEKMVNKPASLTAKIEALQSGIDALVTLCDERSVA